MSTCSKISLIFTEFCSLLLASYFSKKFASKIGAALEIVQPVALTTINILKQTSTYVEKFMVLQLNMQQKVKLNVVGCTCKHYSGHINPYFILMCPFPCQLLALLFAIIFYVVLITILLY